MPEETDVCFNGKENVNPSSLLLSSESSEPSPSFSMNSFNEEAMKSKRSCKKQKSITFHYIERTPSPKENRESQRNTTRAEDYVTLPVLVIRC